MKMEYNNERNRIMGRLIYDGGCLTLVLPSIPAVLCTVIACGLLIGKGCTSLLIEKTENRDINTPLVNTNSYSSQIDGTNGIYSINGLEREASR